MAWYAAKCGTPLIVWWSIISRQYSEKNVANDANDMVEALYKKAAGRMGQRYKRNNNR